ncbi:histidine phosphatase family protein [Paenibacillus xerothermodurans]|uniref:Histidine phosphatase family protein n=1 Tax=Paenibacillus xerothermodurans TaxID=1977292 RepID=A0A2W1NWG8_PAEXE|nr:histidine phosphatase family protein [Paenibacillus xerothermodurans]PZE22066.1 histidine phosphatase family protein [Paenibacillus xerothermodurans]
MEIIFVRHGEGEHSAQIPESYQLTDPGLTEHGIQEAKQLTSTLPLSETDAVIASPTRRTLQTAQLWCAGTNAERYVHPAIGPRQFPIRYDFTTLPCDTTFEPQRLTKLFGDFLLPNDVPAYLWLQGINTVPALLFNKWAEQFIAWCKRLNKDKVYLVTHDGTIAAYMEYLQGTKVARTAQLSQSGWVPLSV